MVDSHQSDVGEASGRRRGQPGRARPFGPACGLAFLPVCASSAMLSAGCTHRSVLEFASKVGLPPGKTSIRLEIQNGTIGIAAGPPGEVAFAGGARRAGESAEELARIEAVPLEFRVVDDPGPADRAGAAGPRAAAGHPWHPCPRTRRPLPRPTCLSTCRSPVSGMSPWRIEWRRAASLPVRATCVSNGVRAA